MPVITCIEDLKQIYKRRVPKMFYDYAETGSWTEQTFLENTSDFQELHFRQKIAVNMEGRSTQTTMIGQDVTMPVALAPVGLTGMQCADGEIKAARAAEKFGVPCTSSTTRFIRWISSRNRTDPGSKLVKIAARSPCLSTTGPEEDLKGTASSFAKILAKVVLPNPGGPLKST